MEKIIESFRFGDVLSPDTIVALFLCLIAIELIGYIMTLSKKVV